MARAVVLLALVGVAVTAAITPVEKVIKLLEDLKTQVEDEGKSEAKTYDEFACFCKDTTDKKSAAILSGKDTIDGLSADISEKTAIREQKLIETQDRKKKAEELSAELSSTQVRCAKLAAEYEANAADVSKALSSLNSAITAMKTSKPDSLLAVSRSVERTLALASGLRLIAAPKKREISAFLARRSSVDPSDPEYRYHSQGIIETLEKLLTDFTAQKKSLDEEWASNKGTCESTVTALNEAITVNAAAISELETSTQDLQAKIAESRQGLVESDGVIQDDQLYLKDLTARCETSAKQFDQRSELRAGELTALAQALALLKGSVSGLDSEVNKRALLQAPGKKAEQAKKAAAPAKKAVPAAAAAPVKPIIKASRPISFLQTARRVADAATLLARRQGALELLRGEGRRLASPELAAMALRVAADPFAKVKKLIQDLVERLLQEATDEATKQGFCNTELGRANKDKEYRFTDAKRSSAELAGLEAKKDELTVEIEQLTTSIAGLRTDLNTATALRAEEKASNIATIAKAREGLQALVEALAILKNFYKQAAKATALIQYSPVDSDTTGPGFSGAYTGQQGSSSGVIGLLEVIKSDFERTVQVTQAAETKGASDFVLFERTSKSDIGAKETQKVLDAEDLNTTNNKIVQETSDLKTAVSLLDAALKTLEELRPLCVDNGMSYEERVAKRDEEIAALKKAVCILDADGVEADCPK